MRRLFGDGDPAVRQAALAALLVEEAGRAHTVVAGLGDPDRSDRGSFEARKSDLDRAEVDPRGAAGIAGGGASVVSADSRWTR